MKVVIKKDIHFFKNELSNVERAVSLTRLGAAKTSRSQSFNQSLTLRVKGSFIIMQADKARAVDSVSRRVISVARATKNIV